MKTRLKFNIAFVSFIVLAFMMACTQSSPERSIEKAQNDLSELKDRLDSIPENDPQYLAQLEQQVNDAHLPGD